MSRSRAVRGKCPGSGGKTRYRNRRAALQGRDRTYAGHQRDAMDGNHLYVYECRVPGCAGWHLTSSSPDEYRARHTRPPTQLPAPRPPVDPAAPSAHPQEHAA